jgi:hypothetical protein
MHDPNSIVVRFRRWLANVIGVRPDPGEGWCLGCCLNDGRTKVIPGDGLREHVDLHASGDYVHIETTKRELPKEMPL